MDNPLLYIFDPESPEEDFLELPFQDEDSEYYIDEYPFLAGVAGSVSITARINKEDLSYFIALQESGVQRMSLSGKKSSIGSADPIVTYTSNSGDNYQICLKI